MHSSLSLCDQKWWLFGWLRWARGWPTGNRCRLLVLRTVATREKEQLLSVYSGWTWLSIEHTPLCDLTTSNKCMADNRLNSQQQVNNMHMQQHLAHQACSSSLVCLMQAWAIKQESRAIAERTARCKCNFLYVSYRCFQQNRTLFITACKKVGLCEKSPQITVLKVCIYSLHYLTHIILRYGCLAYLAWWMIDFIVIM